MCIYIHTYNVCTIISIIIHVVLKDASSRTSTVQVWDSLPPVPDGHLPRESAADVELDMFGVPVCQEPEKPDEQASRGRKMLDGTSGTCHEVKQLV